MSSFLISRQRRKRLAQGAIEEVVVRPRQCRSSDLGGLDGLKKLLARVPSPGTRGTVRRPAEPTLTRWTV